MIIDRPRLILGILNARMDTLMRELHLRDSRRRYDVPSTSNLRMVLMRLVADCDDHGIVDMKATAIAMITGIGHRTITAAIQQIVRMHLADREGWLLRLNFREIEDWIKVLRPPDCEQPVDNYRKILSSPSVGVAERVL